MSALELQSSFYRDTTLRPPALPNQQKYRPYAKLSVEGAHPSQENSWKSTAVVVGKVVFALIVIAGLVAATVFSCGAAAALAAAGAALWKVALIGALAGASGIAAAGSLYFACSDHMYKDTGENLDDCFRFVGHSVGTGLYLGAEVVRTAADIAFWDLIFNW